MCWAIFLIIILLHYLNFKDTDAKKRAIADITYYVLLITWYVGIIAHYGATNSN
jgi:amino acid transporter